MSSDLSIAIAGFCTVATSPFLYCLWGKNGGDSYAKMADRLFESDWHHFPVKLQKYFVIMIANMHRPLYYNGFGIAVLDLETFRNVSE